MYTRAHMIAAVREAFAGSEVQALGILDQYGTAAHERERERVQMAIVALSKGSLDRLRQLVDEAKRDYRDILCMHDAGPLPAEEGERLRQAAVDIVKTWGRK